MSFPAPFLGHRAIFQLGQLWACVRGADEPASKASCQGWDAFCALCTSRTRWRTGSAGLSTALTPAVSPEGTFFFGHLHSHFQQEQVVLSCGQHIWPNADGQIAGAHCAGETGLPDVREQGEQPLEEIGCRQLVATLKEQEHNVNKVGIVYMSPRIA